MGPRVFLPGAATSRGSEGNAQSRENSNASTKSRPHTRGQVGSGGVAYANRVTNYRPVGCKQCSFFRRQYHMSKMCFHYLRGNWFFSQPDSPSQLPGFSDYYI